MPVLVSLDDPHAVLPRRANQHDAGADVSAALPPESQIVIAPGGRALIPTGLRMEIPEGFEVQIRPRSGLALKHGVTVLNSPGTIDSGYRGPVGVVLANHGEEPFIVRRGDRVAQLVIAELCEEEFTLAQTPLSTTGRGEAGFGSSGTTVLEESA